MSGEMIDFNGDGDTYQGYLAKPESGGGPGVIVIQEWWGLVGHIKSVSDRFANEGFVALAPDLYLGDTAEEPDAAGKMMMALNIDKTEEILSGAVTKLLETEGVKGSQVGVVGFCMGGQLALHAAALNKQIGACVDYYGIHPNVNPPLVSLQAPVLGFFAENDEFATPESVRELDEKLTDLGKPHEFKTYPGTDHAFFNDERPEVYDKEAAEDSWRRMVAFFKQHL
jgi:carboxymethylenebutenolidase